MKRKRKRKILTGIACFFCMAFLCTACGADKKEAEKEIPTIRIMAWSAGHTNENQELDLVNEALGDLTQKKIGCRLELVYPSNTLDYRLLLGSKEKMGNQADIVGMYGGTYESYLKEGYLMRLDPYIEEYGDGILETLGCEREELRIKGYKGEEGIYGIPKAMPEIHIKGVVVRTDLLEKYGFSLDDVKKMEDLEPFLECIAKNEELSPIVPTAAMGGFFVNENLDLVDSAGAIAVRKKGDSLEIENFFETSEFESYAKMMKRWREKGILSNQIGREDELGLNLVVAGKAAATELIIRPDEVEEWKGIYGDTITIKEFDMKPFMTTRHKWRYNWFVNSECKYPELAIQALNLMYTDPEISNLVINGIEGIHYEFKDKAQGIIGYPEGVDSTNVGYSRLAWGWPNEQISYVWETDKPTVWEELGAFNAGMNLSPAKGFTFDNAAVLNQVTACTNVTQQYDAAIKGGSLDPATAIDEFNAALKAAGIDDIIAEKQKQLDEWLAAQK